jgi:F-type H+-transporting ATPase subunit delta
MLNPRLAGRYAKSLLDLAIEKGQLERIYEDMVWLKSVNSTNRDFLNVLRSPVIKGDKKMKIIEAVVGKRVDAITLGFIRLMISKTREEVLPEVITSFISQYKTHKNIHVVKLTTAVPISSAIEKEIIAQVRKTSGLEHIEVESKVDENIIGGFVLQTGDKLIDASIAYDLKAIERQFENNDFIYKIR